MLPDFSGMFAALISWLPSGFTLATSGLLFLAGIGGLVYQRFPLLPHRTLVLVAAVAAIYASAWAAGAGNMRAEQERQALLAANRTLVKEVTSERLKVEGLQADARKAAENLKAATARAEAAEGVAATLPSDALDAATSEAIRNLWRQ
ncbi:hypothetical protein [Xanthobacter flavus]|uniref:hypothetical protein n=1 Tax=Xanthobacter flavus TaxID=281 RepID=UPI001AE2078B|nr:hypothetical protein [Xanthobacter flavus]MBP2147914.1 hypothetical protein [Xanthobacter flavus]